MEGSTFQASALHQPTKLQDDTLPLKTASPPADPTTPIALTGIRVLVVDDSPDN